VLCESRIFILSAASFDTVFDPTVVFNVSIFLVSKIIVPDMPTTVG
jgi:hypothetical protein